MNILMNKVPAHTHGAGVSSSGLHKHNFIEELRPTAFSDPNDQSGLTRETGSNGGAIAGPHVTDAGAHIHTVSIATNTGASDWFPKYTNLIIGVKQ